MSSSSRICITGLIKIYHLIKKLKWAIYRQRDYLRIVLPSMERNQGGNGPTIFATSVHLSALRTTVWIFMKYTFT